MPRLHSLILLFHVADLDLEAEVGVVAISTSVIVHADHPSMIAIPSDPESVVRHLVGVVMNPETAEMIEGVIDKTKIAGQTATYETEMSTTSDVTRQPLVSRHVLRFRQHLGHQHHISLLLHHSLLSANVRSMMPHHASSWRIEDPP